jgi:hypothetical protein
MEQAGSEATLMTGIGVDGGVWEWTGDGCMGGDEDEGMDGMGRGEMLGVLAVLIDAIYIFTNLMF